MSAQPDADAFDLLLVSIRETYRKRQDLLRAELRLGGHIEAVYRRFTGLKQDERARLRKKASTGMGHAAGDTQKVLAHPDDDSAGGGHKLADFPPESAPALAALTPQQRLAARCKADPAFFAAKMADAEDWCAQLVHGRDYYADARKPYEKYLERLVTGLPVWPWAASVRGFGALGLAQIVGECGDLHNYANPAKVWTRMGLGFADMGDGTFERQRKTTDKALAVALGYNAQRRSIMYVIADSLMKGNRDGEYRAYYLAEKERQREKLPDAPAAHIDNRARRHLAKRLLRNLWKAWRASLSLSPPLGVPGHAPTDFALAADD